MGSLFIETQIDSQRVLTAGQPPWETIELDVALDYGPLVTTPYLETARFSDFLRSGGESVRYYHLVAYGRGLCLCLPPSGEGRVMSGTYFSREVSISRSPVDLAKLYFSEPDPWKPINVAKLSHIYLLLRPKGKIIARFNCLESFGDHWSLSASLRIPECFLHGHSRSSIFADIFARHQLLKEPCFEFQNVKTIDATLAIKTNRLVKDDSIAQLQIASQVIDLPLLASPMVL